MAVEAFGGGERGDRLRVRRSGLGGVLDDRGLLAKVVDPEWRRVARGTAGGQHVIATREEAAATHAVFGFEDLENGTTAPGESFGLDPAAGFYTSEADDFTLVRFASHPETRYPPIEITQGVKDGDRVAIVQHPAGGPKQVSVHRNLVTWVGEGRVQYLTDTLPGSSGAPVFDVAWRLVAVHHSGGFLREPGRPERMYRNEGIEIARVWEALASR